MIASVKEFWRKAASPVVRRLVTPHRRMDSSDIDHHLTYGTSDSLESATANAISIERYQHTDTETDRPTTLLRL